MTNPKRGQRVRVTIEAVVGDTYFHPDGFGTLYYATSGAGRGDLAVELPARKERDTDHVKVKIEVIEETRT